MAESADMQPGGIAAASDVGKTVRISVDLQLKLMLFKGQLHAVQLVSVTVINIYMLVREYGLHIILYFLKK